MLSGALGWHVCSSALAHLNGCSCHLAGMCAVLSERTRVGGGANLWLAPGRCRLSGAAWLFCVRRWAMLPLWRSPLAGGGVQSSAGALELFLPLCRHVHSAIELPFRRHICSAEQMSMSTPII